MFFLSFLACETMVGYSPARLLPLVSGCAEGLVPLPYWGIFSGTEYCGSENSLTSYGIFRWQISARLQASPLATSSVLVFSVAAPSVLRIGLAASASSALPIGAKTYCTGSRSNLCTHGSIWTCRKGVPRTLLADAHRLSVLPCHCQGICRFGNRSPIYPPPLRDCKRSSV